MRYANNGQSPVHRHAYHHDASNGTMTVMGKSVLRGDEGKVQLPISYIAPPYVIPGMGTLKIKSCQHKLPAKRLMAKILLQTDMFDSHFKSQARHSNPHPVAPYPMPRLLITASKFISMNIKFLAT